MIDAVNFAAENGYRFLSLYDFDAVTGAWTYRGYEERYESFGLNAALKLPDMEPRGLTKEVRTKQYSAFLHEARALADELGDSTQKIDRALKAEFGDLQFFST